MKKKIIPVLLCVAMAFSLAGCGETSTTVNDTSEEDATSKISDKLATYVDAESETDSSASIEDSNEYVSYTNDLIDYVYEYTGYLSAMASFEKGQLMNDSIEPETAFENALEFVEEDYGVSEDAICTASLNYIYESCQSLEPVPDAATCQEAYDAADYFVGIYAELYHAAIFNMGIFDKEACQSALSSASSDYLTAAEEYKSYIGEEEDVVEEEQQITDEMIAEEAEFIQNLQEEYPDLYEGYMEISNVLSYMNAGIDAIINDFNAYRTSDDGGTGSEYYAIDQDLFGFEGHYLIWASKEDGHIMSISYVLESSVYCDSLANDINTLFGETHTTETDEDVKYYAWDTDIHVATFLLEDTGIGNVLNEKVTLTFVPTPDYKYINPDYDEKESSRVE